MLKLQAATDLQAHVLNDKINKKKNIDDYANYTDYGANNVLNLKPQTKIQINGIKLRTGTKIRSEHRLRNLGQQKRPFTTNCLKKMCNEEKKTHTQSHTPKRRICLEKKKKKIKENLEDWQGEK